MFLLSLLAVPALSEFTIENQTTVVQAQATATGAKIVVSLKSDFKLRQEIDFPSKVEKIGTVGRRLLLIRGTSDGLKWNRRVELDPTNPRLSMISSYRFQSEWLQGGQATDQFRVGASSDSFNTWRLASTDPVFITPKTTLVKAPTNYAVDYVERSNDVFVGFYAEEPAENGSFQPISRQVPPLLEVRYNLFFGDDSWDTAGRWSWQQYGRRALDDPRPQCVPFDYLTQHVYNFGEEEEEGPRRKGDEEEEEGPWWTGEMKGVEVGGPRKPGLIRWTIRENSMRASWGMKWWGEKLAIPEWKEHAEQLLNLMIVAPRKEGNLPRSFQVEKKLWDSDGNVDDTAANLYWAVRWAESWPEPELSEELEPLFTDFLKNCDRVLKLSESAVVSEVRVLISSDNRPHLTYSQLRLLQRLSMSQTISRDIAESAKQKLKRWETLRTKNQIPEGDPFPFENTQGRSEWMLEPGSAKFATKPKLSLFSDNQLVHSSLDSYGLINPGRLALIQMRFGAMADRKDIFERGVVTLRNQLQLLSSPPLLGQGVRGPRIEVGRAASYYNADIDSFGPWLSFESCEGQILASVAEALDEFGGFYEHSSGWKVGIDGCKPGPDGRTVSILTMSPRPYLGVHKVKWVKRDKSKMIVDVRAEPVINRLELKSISNKIIVSAIPAGNSKPGTNEGVFSCDSPRWKAKATLGASGFEAAVPKSIVTSGKLAFNGKLHGTPVSSRPELLPTFESVGWHSTGDFQSVLKLGSVYLSTDNDSKGSSKTALVGTIVSDEFWSLGGTLRFQLKGFGQDVRVLLIDVLDGSTLEEVVPEGDNSIQVDWNLGRFNGRKVKIELIDRTDSGYVSIRDLRLVP